MARHGTASEPRFLRLAAEYARLLPRRLRDAIAQLRTADREPGLLIKGLVVDDAAIGPTPPHWRDMPAPPARTTTRREEFIVGLVAAAFGDVFGYASLQDGRVLHHLVPTRGNEDLQIGSSSTTELAWHSEDAFAPVRCDFLMLFGLRNPDRVGTMFAPIDALGSLTEADRNVLSQRRFVIRADDEHLKNAQASRTVSAASIFDPEHYADVVAVLQGARLQPDLVIDKAFMAAQPGDREAEVVLARAVSAIDAAIAAIPIGPGELFILDNHRAVHGRAPFSARYDGRDRWLLRASVTRDLTKSLPFRESAASRIVN